MRNVALSLLLLVPLLAAGCFGPPSAAPDDSEERPLAFGPAMADPLAYGPFAVAVREFDAGTVLVGGAGPDHKDYEYEAPLRGFLHVPAGDGPFPVVVFEHGRHGWCGFMGRESFISPFGCEDEPWHNYPSYRGYDYLGQHLASHGYVVASIDVNWINARDGSYPYGMWARGELALAALDLLLAANASQVDLGLDGRLDLTRIGLMGHSRGGEGVVTATHVNRERADPYPIRAVVALAPTDFHARPALDAALLSIVPYCDGDVSSLHGLRTFDHTRYEDPEAAKIQLLVAGANHNHYNTKWGKEYVAGLYRDGDDAQAGRHRNAECDVSREQGGGRLTREDTWRQATLQINGFLRWTLGDETSLAPYFDGSTPMPDAVCPAGQGPCPEAVSVSAILPGHRWLFNATEDGALGFNNASVSFDGFATSAPCQMQDCDGNVYSAAWAFDLAWDAPATVRADVPTGLLTGMDVLAFRAGVPSQGDANEPDALVDVSVVVEAADGTRHAVAASKFSTALRHPPGETLDESAGDIPLSTGFTKVSYNMVRVPLSAFAVPPEDVVAVEIVFDRTPSGRILLADAWVQPDLRSAFDG